LPRLSIDIDLAYIGFESRKEAFANINNALEAIRKRLIKNGIMAEIRRFEDGIEKMFCKKDEIEIKVKPNYDRRGYIYEPEMMLISSKINEIYKVGIDMQLLAIPELYGGKFHAAVIRQHPRDLFDMRILLQNEGITSEIKKSFIENILTDKGTPYEMLAPNEQDRKEVFEKKFVGMETNVDFSYEKHQETFRAMMNALHQSFTENDKKFLISFFSLEPKWDLVNIPNMEKLPAVKWKIINLEKMPHEALKEQVKKIEKAFEVFENKAKSKQ
jgi:hypothetical protein